MNPHRIALILKTLDLNVLESDREKRGSLKLFNIKRNIVQEPLKFF